jgi:hypothetical protein
MSVFTLTIPTAQFAEFKLWTEQSAPSSVTQLISRSPAQWLSVGHGFVQREESLNIRTDVPNQTEAVYFKMMWSDLIKKQYR